MGNTRSGNTPRSLGNLSARPPATDTDPSTPIVDPAEVTANANNPNDSNDPNIATLIGTTMTGTTTMATPKVHTLVIAKIILLCGFPEESTMVRYIDQQDWTELEDYTLIGVL
jgi:hypothetical protein